MRDIEIIREALNYLLGIITRRRDIASQLFEMTHDGDARTVAAVEIATLDRKAERVRRQLKALEAQVTTAETIDYQLLAA